jgi:RNA polymerase-associated protein
VRLARVDVLPLRLPLGRVLTLPRGASRSLEEGKRLRESLVASVPVFKASKFFLNTEMSLVDCALAPLLWRLPSLGVVLPREAQVITDYGDRIFRSPGFARSMTEEEKALRPQ